VADVSIRRLAASDEAEARAAHAELAAEDFDFLLAGEDEGDWAQYLRRLEDIRAGINLPPGYVAATFLVAEVDGRVAGRVSVRHALTPWLAEWGGHIGFGVRPAFRRRGVAAALLRAGLRVAGDVQIERALVTCDVGNVASAATIERCGGVFERLSRPDEHGDRVRRYWFDRAAGDASAAIARQSGA
jgi:predicted acetyltransferase